MMKKRLLSLLLVFALLAGLLPTTAAAVESPGTVTFTLWAVLRDDTSGNNAAYTGDITTTEGYDPANISYTWAIKPTQVTCFANTTLADVLYDLTGDTAQKNTTFTTSAGAYYGRPSTVNTIASKTDYTSSTTRWRAFSQVNGETEAYYNVRDRVPQAGETILLTTTTSGHKDGYKTLPETLYSDLTFVAADAAAAAGESAVAVMDLTSGVDGALTALGSEEFLSGLLNGNASPETVTSDLKLPGSVTDADGQVYRLTWQSSTGVDDPAGRVTVSATLDTSTKSYYTGKVVRAADGQDRQVTLTATVRGGPTKTFSVTVKAYSEDENAVNAVAAQVKEWNFIENGNGNGSTYKTKITKDLYLPSQLEEYPGVTIQWTSSNKAIASDGTVTRPANSGKDVSNIKLTYTVSKEGVAPVTGTITGLKVLKYTDAEVALDEDQTWLSETWATAQNLNALTGNLTLPTTGEAGTTIGWDSDNPLVLSTSGEVTRPAAGAEAADAALTATLSFQDKNSRITFTRTVTLQAKVLPWSEAEREPVQKAIQALTEKIDALALPGTVNASNQADVTAVLRANRAAITAAYAAALEAGASSVELNGLSSYQLYLNAEASLRKLSKTVTVSIVNVTKTADNHYTTDGSYLLGPHKVVIEGTKDGGADNDVKSVLNGLKTAAVFSGSCTGALSVTLDDGTSIKAAKDADKTQYQWYYLVNGEKQGVYTGASSGKNQTLEHGDNLVFYFLPETDATEFYEAYQSGLSDSAAVDYDFAKPELFDAGWLTSARILGEKNAAVYIVTDDLTLPDKGKCGSKITWESDAPGVISAAGKVTRPSVTDGNRQVTLTATIGSGTAQQIKTFSLTVRAEEATADEKTALYAAEQLELEGLDAVTSDLTLPTTGFGGAVITWTSSNAAVLSETGAVTRPNEDTTVTLTATIQVGAAVRTKDFSVTVLRQASSAAEQVAYDKEALTFAVIRRDNTEQTDIRTDLTLPSAGAMGSAIRWSSSDTTVLSDTGKVTRPANGSPEASVTLTATLTNGAATDTKEFVLTVPALSKDEQLLVDAEAAIDALPEALRISVEDRDEVQALADAAQEKVDRAVKAGQEKGSISNLSHLQEVQTKLSKLPVEVTFSILGATIENQMITGREWLIERTKLLVPADSNLADVTEAMINGYDSVREGSGKGYYGTILGLSQFDAGSASGWIYGGQGERIDTTQGALVSILDQGCVVYWAFTGIPAPGVSAGTEGYDLTTPLGKDHPVDKDLVPMPNFAALQKLIDRAEAMRETEYRDFGAWAGTWDAMQTALTAAKTVAAAPNTALDYEVDDAIEALSAALGKLQPTALDTTTLSALVEQANRLQESDYYHSGWAAMTEILAEATEVLADPYADAATLDALAKDLQKALDRLIPVTEQDKTALQAALDQNALLTAEAYTLSSWRQMQAAQESAQAVMDDPSATEGQVQAALAGLENAAASLQAAAYSGRIVNPVVYQAIEDWQGTTEAWKVFDMALLGRAGEANIDGYLMEVSALLDSGKASATDLERTAIVLTALGYDVTNITLADGKTFDLIAALEKIDLETVPVNAVVFALLAIDSGSYEAAAFRAALIDRLLELQQKDGGWPIYADSQMDWDMTAMAAMAVTALAPYIGETRVSAALAKAAKLLLDEIDMFVSTPAAYGGNCNTTAMVLIAMASIPQLTDKEIEKFDIGGLSHYVTETNRLGYQNKLTENDLATEQGVRAHVVHDEYKAGNGVPFFAYRFSAPTEQLVLPKVEFPVIRTDLTSRSTSASTIRFTVSAATDSGGPAAVTVTVNGAVITASNGVYTAPLTIGSNTIVIQAVGTNNAVETQTYLVRRTEGASPSPSNTMEVTFRLVGAEKATQQVDLSRSDYLPDYVTWIPTEEYTLSKGSTVYDLFVEALADAGLRQVGAESNYVETIYAPAVLGGYALSEEDNGPLSGWMYTVNGSHPGVGLKDYSLRDGDTVIWHYVNDPVYEVKDWSEGPSKGDASTWSGWLKAADVAPGKADKPELPSDEAAGKVIKLISAIGIVDENSGAAIQAAREAYDKLTSFQKTLVTNYMNLVQAEAAYAALTAGISFTDVTTEDYFYDAVLWAVQQKITNGISATAFGPEESCTRAQMVTFLWRAAGSPEAHGETVFTDVDKDAYYYEALLWAVEKGITTGTSATTFHPDAVCTRGQMAAFLYRSAEMPAVSGGHPFADVTASDYFNDAVTWAASEGITTGTSADTFSPEDDCTRGQIVTFLYRAQ